MQEDHVSMGWGAARKLRRSVANLRRILAVEVAAAARAIELRKPLEPAKGTCAALDAVRSAGVAPAGADRWLAPDLARVEGLLASGVLLSTVEGVTGELA
jgi:histidine ammonia-lyase